MIQRTSFILLLLVLTACAGMTPEQKLDQGYKSTSATVKGTTVLLDRKAISSAEGQRVHDLGVTAKAGLDDDSKTLAACRAKGPTAVCDDTNASISLYSGVLQQLETFLKAKGAQ